MKCPNCGNELDEDNYCDECIEFFNNLDDDSSDFDFEEEPDFDSMVNNGDEICLNCTYWSVSPYGRAHGMANYGDEGQFQFDETSRDISNKLNNWRNSRY